MRSTVATLLTATSVALAGCGGASSSNGPAQGGPVAATIEISDFKFAPAAVTVRVGSSIRFVNRGPSAHTASATAGGFDTGTLKGGESKTITVGALGTAVYRCQVHPSMTGQIVIVK